MDYNLFKKQAMIKQADGGVIGTLTSSINAVQDTATDIGDKAITAILAAAFGLGAGGGYLAAKANAKTTQDIETIKKQYENERLKADIGYLAGKLKQESASAENLQKPKAARVIA